MEVLAAAFNICYQFLNSFAFLVLSASGLAIIFGMMGIINLAHGEFIMIGAYLATALAKSGVPLWISILLGALGVALLGFVLDRAVFQHLYSRPLDSVVASWGISLMISQGMLILFGPSFEGVATPLGSLNVGGSSYSVYRILLGCAAVAVLALLYWLFMHTVFGLKARATMQNREIAQGLGVRTDQIYTHTFMLGAGLAGLTGGLYAPTATLSPQFGSSFLIESFVTVIVGGANPLVGTALSGGGLGAINSILSLLYGTFIGRVGLLIVAILVIRLLPNGITGFVERRIVGGYKK